MTTFILAAIKQLTLVLLAVGMIYAAMRDNETNNDN